jgi:hypothetical protein
LPDEDLGIADHKRKKMLEAVVKGDLNKLLDLIEKSGLSSSAAGKLRTLAENYEYETLQKILAD